MADITVEQLVDEMFDMVSKYHGKKNFKASDLRKEMIKKHGDEGVDRAICKKAIRQLMDSGKCVYSYFGGSFITLPPEEGVDK